MAIRDNYEIHSTQLPIDVAKRILGLYDNAFSDYLSARVLYNSNLLVQATILANTALEKFFKAYLEVMGLKINIKHDPLKLLQLVKTHSSGIAAKINEGFLGQLTKIYRSRYLENVSPGYNYVILRRKYLAELDFIFSVFEPLMRFQNSREKEYGESRHQHAIAEMDERLYYDNYILMSIDKTDFVEAVDIIEEFRISAAHQTLQITYYTASSKNDGNFQYIGWALTEDENSYNLSHIPFNQNI
jgi:HEPN domain-containing protein